jgi:small conductance mechanosensitive channel
MQSTAQSRRLRLVSSFVLMLSLTGSWSSAAFGQDESTETKKTFAEQAQERIDELKARETDLEELRAKIAANEGNAASTILQKELVERRSRYRRAIVELVDLVANGADSGADVAQARSVATRALEQDADVMRQELGALSARMVELVELTGAGNAEEAEKARKERDAALPVSNRLLKELDANIDARERLGLDVKADIASLTEGLKTRSAMVAGGLQHTKDEIDEIVKRPGADQDAQTQKELAQLKDERDLLAETQRLNADLMDERGLDTTELRQGIIIATGKISDDILNGAVATGLIKEWTADAADWLRSNGAGLFFRVVIFLLILLAFWILARIGRGLVRRALDRSKLNISSLAREFFIKMTVRLILLLGFIIAIAQLGIEVAPLLAGLGIAGFVIGFALQDTLSNFASGMMILIYRPFDVGDVIEAGGVMGKVDQMNLVATMVLTPDNQLLVVPNKQIWGGVIRNVTHNQTRRVDLTFGIGYSDDISKAEKVLAEILSSHEKVLKDPAPVIRLHELGDSSVNFVVRPWSKTGDYWDVYWDITREVKRRFDQEGISIPFPQRDVHIYREDGGGAEGA